MTCRPKAAEAMFATAARFDMPLNEGFNKVAAVYRDLGETKSANRYEKLAKKTSHESVLTSIL